VTPGQIVIVVLASAVGALIKGVTGMGYPLFAVPIIALATGVQDAVVVVAVPNVAANLYLCWEARSARHEALDLGRLVIPGLVGAVVGAVALVSLPDEPLLLALALTIAVFIVQYVRNPELRMPRAVARRWSPIAGAAAGLMQGAIGVSGPVIATWLHGYGLARDAYVYTITLLFGLTGAVQLATLAAQGAMTRDRALASAAAAVPTAIMIPLGVRLRRRLGGPAFERAVLVVLALSAVSLLLEVFS